MTTGRAPRQKAKAGSTFKGMSFAACTATATLLSAADAMLQAANTTARNLAKPFIKMLPYKIIILQVRIEPANAINLFHLTGGKFFFGIETPAAFQQPLSAQDLVNPGNASVEVMRRIEERGVRI